MAPSWVLGAHSCMHFWKVVRGVTGSPELEAYKHCSRMGPVHGKTSTVCYPNTKKWHEKGSLLQHHLLQGKECQVCHFPAGLDLKCGFYELWSWDRGGRVTKQQGQWLLWAGWSLCTATIPALTTHLGYTAVVAEKDSNIVI